MDKYSSGLKAEIKARGYLEQKGYSILDTNVAYKNIGELDIVAKDGTQLVFVEVRYRSTNAYGHPLETLTSVKRNRIIRASACYIAETKSKFSNIRFDVVAITDSSLEHIENAFFRGWN